MTGVPPPHPLLGHLLAFRRDRVGLLAACAAAPGDVIRLRIRTPAYVLKRAEDVRHVFTAQGVYAKAARMTSPRATRIAGSSVLTTEDDEHRQSRREAQPVFRRASISGLGGVIVRGVDRMLDHWEDGSEIDLPIEMISLARKNIVSCVFGVEEEPELSQIDTGVVERRRSLDRVRDALVPPPAFVPLGLSPRRRRALAGLEEIIERRFDDGATQAETHDLLSTLLRTDENEFSAERRRHARDEALTFALTGSENVARTLIWTVLELARHPAVEERLRAEVQSVLGPCPPDGADAERLQYTEMVVAETMRLWPPNPLLIRVARRNDVLPCGTRVERGSKLLLSPYVVQREPAYFEDPTTFEPERFSAGGSRRPSYAYFPFGGGPRVCIGQSLATLTCVLALARIAQRYRLQLVPGRPVPRYTGDNIQPGGGPTMRVSLASIH